MYFYLRQNFLDYCIRVFAPLLSAGILLVISGCMKEKPARFETLSPDKTNITFSNDLKNTPGFNIINYLYFYDGGGVSIGDINNDGLSDLYLTANMKSNKLYLNKGDFEFQDITRRAGVEGSGDWTTGTTMADVNGDGMLDLYVCNVNYKTKKGKNQLFINNGDSTFTERAEEFGLDFTGYSKQAAFFDYDRDGDLDLYLLNHAVHTKQSFARARQREVEDPDAGDRLYRNDGGTFTNVTKEAGIYNSILGYGLAVSTSDLNNDGWADIYVSNDFHENDYLYLNQGDGTFEEILERSTGHTSRASMGNDIADINNDGYTDIYVADMLPMSEKRRKTAVSSESYKIYTIQRQFGYHPQLIQNTLQLNRGTGPDGQLRFSEIAQYAGVNATGWSWAPLLLDMNNDGFKDLYVTNGIYRRPNDLDYLLFVRRDTTQQSMNRGGGAGDMEVIDRMPHSRLPNAGFLNKGDNTFANESSSLGFTEAGYSSGASYGDLDNDGDLDLVTNNVNGAATIQRNMTRERKEGNYLQVRLEGEKANTFGIGSKVMVYDSSSVQKYELFTTRGFLSSVEPMLTIGLGASDSVDSLEVVWPDGSSQILRDLKANQRITLRQDEARGADNNHLEFIRTGGTSIFKNISSRFSLDYRHKEDAYTDYNQQQLSPFMLSSQGPASAAGDINNDGLEDFFIGGAKQQAGRFFVQREDGTFQEKTLPTLEHDATFEDVDAELFDANGDGALDLYVVSGGNEFAYQTAGLRDRFYFNTGNGEFVRVGDAFPKVLENGSVVATVDYDRDGDLDLFAGSRSVPQNYGISPNSHLFENQGNGQFRDVTEKIAPGLNQLGMVTDATWTDLDSNGTPDLIVAGEWMPLTIFLNKAGRLKPLGEKSGLRETNGWWQSIETGDFDDDGDMDFVAGNMGTNSFLKASREEPIVMYLKDYNKDGQIDPIVGYTIGDEEFPVAPRDELLTQFKFLRPRFDSYREYAGKTIQEIFGEMLTEGDWEKKTVTTLKSMYVENRGNQGFKIHPLPGKVQWSPVLDFEVDDFGGDGHLDLLTAGNFHEVKPSLGGRFDAGYGVYLEGNGDGTFRELNMQKSGLVIDGEARAVIPVKLGRGSGQRILVVTRNDASLLFFSRKGAE